MKILAVDDDPIIHDLLREGLAVQGHENMTFASSAEEALTLIDEASEPFGTFLLDVTLPGTDGIDLCAEIRTKETYKMTPVIVITASRDAEIMERAFAAGATDYVTKPFDGLELGTRVNLAAMLHDSIVREHQSQNRLEELARDSQIGFDDRVALTNVYGLCDILAIENQLLRSTEGCYAMSLYAIKIPNARAHYNTMSAAQFRQDLECIGAAIADCVNMASTQIAYAGRGTFVVVQHGRRRVDIRALGDDIRMRLNETWRPVSAGARSAPALNSEEISGNRLWTGMGASEALRAYLNKTDPAAEAEPPKNDSGLFTSSRRRAAGEN